MTTKSARIGSVGFPGPTEITEQWMEMDVKPGSRSTEDNPWYRHSYSEAQRWAGPYFAEGVRADACSDPDMRVVKHCPFCQGEAWKKAPTFTWVCVDCRALYRRTTGEWVSRKTGEVRPDPSPEKKETSNGNEPMESGSLPISEKGVSLLKAIAQEQASVDPFASGGSHPNCEKLHAAGIQSDAPTGTVLVRNLRTGQELEFSCDPRKAVMAAHAQEWKNFSTWDYEDCYGGQVEQHTLTWVCGDWAAFKTGKGSVPPRSAQSAPADGRSKGISGNSRETLLTFREKVAILLSDRKREAAWEKAARRAKEELSVETTKATESKSSRVHGIQEGTYTLVQVMPQDAADKHRTVRIEENENPEFFNGEGMVCSFLSGPDNNRDYTSFGILKDDGRLIIWKKFRGNGSELLFNRILDLLKQDAISAGERFALRSGRCFHCRRKLTVPASLHRGLGPVCSALFNV